jgi:hypothetical protein
VRHVTLAIRSGEDDDGGSHQLSFRMRVIFSKPIPAPDQVRRAIFSGIMR